MYINSSRRTHARLMACAFRVALSMFLRVLTVICLWHNTLVDGAFSDSSETREVLSLDGLWNCFCERREEPFINLNQGDLRKLNGIVKVPVPGNSVDFITQLDPKNCPGKVWYDRRFFVPTSWKHNRNIWLRIGIPAESEVWINEEKLEAEQACGEQAYDVTGKLLYDKENRIALALNGLQLPLSVSLHSVPNVLYIKNVHVSTTIEHGTAFVSYKVDSDGLRQQPYTALSVEVFDMNQTLVANQTVHGSPLEGSFSIPNCQLWWPVGMQRQPGYLYTFVFGLYCICSNVVKDVYRQRIGIRSLSWSNCSMMVNGKGLYLKGVELARKPNNPRTDLKDFALLKWLNANAVVTRLHPSEDFLDLADEMGIVVILGVSRYEFEGVIRRLRHHPSVIIWSVEGDCNSTDCQRFQDSLVDFGKTLDNSRPFTGLVQFSAALKHASNKFDIASVSLQDVPLASMKNITTALNVSGSPALIMFGEKFISHTMIETLNYDYYAEVIECQRSFRRAFPSFGTIFGNFIAYDDVIDDQLRFVDGIFDRNREPTALAYYIRSKFKEGRTPCKRKVMR